MQKDIPNEKDFESIPKFSRRVGLPDELIRILTKQGQIPTMQYKSRIYICISGGRAYLQQRAQMRAEDIAARLPVPVAIRPRREKKSIGRRPDSVRLGKS